MAIKEESSRVVGVLAFDFALSEVACIDRHSMQ